MRILNLYAGIGGNRKYWDGHEVVAVEYSQEIADLYQSLYPNDQVICADAHEYLLEHFSEFDFIWSSPPCQSHSRMIRSGRNRKPRYVDLGLYEEIMLLRDRFEGKFIVENVVPWYEPFIPPSFKVGRHLFWSNFDVWGLEDVKRPSGFINKQNAQAKQELMDWLGIHFEKNIYYEGNHDLTQILRNCVHPLIGLQIINQL